MNKTKIFTDSTADLSKELITKYDISVIPLYVNIKDESYYDGVNINTEQLYLMADQYQTLPKTSAPTMADYIDAFTPYIERGYDIVYIGISSDLSVTVQSAKMAAAEFEENRIFVIDSKNVSTGIAILAIKAAKLASQGLDARSIVNEINKCIPKIRSSFVISTLKYIRMSGRCTAIQMIAGNILNIKPRIVVEDGKLVVASKYRGKLKNVLDKFYDEYVGDGHQIDPERVFITHSMCREGAEYLKEKLIKNLKLDEAIITNAGSVISSHCGPGTVGILYLEKDSNFAV